MSIPIGPMQLVLATMNPVFKDPSSSKWRVEAVRQTLDDFPVLITCGEIYRCMMEATKNTTDEKIEQLRQKWSFSYHFPQKNPQQSLVLTPEAFALTDPEMFWNYLTKHEINRIRINDDQGAMDYEKGFFKFILDKKPPLNELFERYPLEFTEGNIAIPKAKLRCCNEYFDVLFQNQSVKRADLRDITQKGFFELLRAFENEEYDFSYLSEEFHAAAQYLHFSLTIELPEKLMSKESMEATLGNIGEVHYPRGFLETLNEACPFSNSEFIKTIDTHIVRWVPDQITAPNQLDKILKSKKIQGLVSPLGAIGNQKVKGGYWVLMYRGELQGLKIIDKYKNYELPNLIDVMFCTLMLSENILRSSYTYCKESGRTFEGTWQMVAGMANSLSLDTMCHYHYMNSSKIGICPVRKFYFKP